MFRLVCFMSSLRYTFSASSTTFCRYSLNVRRGPDIGITFIAVSFLKFSFVDSIYKQKTMVYQDSISKRKFYGKRRYSMNADHPDIGLLRVLYHSKIYIFLSSNIFLIICAIFLEFQRLWLSRNPQSNFCLST